MTVLRTLVLLSMGRVNSRSVAATKRRRSTQDGNSLEDENARLKAQNRELLDLTEWRSASMAHLAHELRTPLTSILGFSEILLSQEELSESQRNFCERIQNSAQQLQRTLTELSELSRVEARPRSK
ncbi:MAG TPA: histidine kinase dimerization/phospho-acceptor domain-containing protein [Pyrinomonadaceae bacterium]|nr:histidine kinase dimerization/phospho-acceptor domain-containing protein [Pyrinomonadaceae bacterium]